MLYLENGVVYRNLNCKILLDPYRKVRESLVCITHGHADHIREHETHMLMTEPTSKVSGLKAKTLDYGESYEYYGCKITPYPAGHVLGSAQFKIDDGSSTVFTGDFKMQDSIVLEGAETISCDELIIESTYGLKEFEFPDRETVYSNLLSWVKKNYEAGNTIILGGYSLGKAQELTKLITKEKYLPLVHPDIYDMNRIYEEDKIKLGEYISTNMEEAKEIMRGNFIAIVPHNLINHKFLEVMKKQYGRIVSALATGWSLICDFKRLKGVDRAFPLSDHADYKQLIQYVELSEAKRIYTVHGYTYEFARQLKRFGYDAKPLNNQTRLTFYM